MESRTGSASFDLRFYGSEEYVTPVWWIGVAGPDGELRVTDVLSGARPGVEGLLRWLTPIAGAATARDLVRRVVDVTTDSAAAPSGPRDPRPG
jgi:hypothetical protein